mmetsp:Transcript_3703/g.6310  ORF Transcript_3703/g.6310 Transcript_3703/m.6310 type:complete len:129 (-) Transcript_3703:611-997(-)
MMQWVFNTPERAPAFILASEGYDVWLGNNRGNRFSQSHLSLSTNQSEYWNFSWEEMGVYDTPALIDYILEETDFQKINYIGHSEGTTQIIAGASLIPQYYTQKMNVCLFMAPPASMMHTPNLLMRIGS